MGWWDLGSGSGIVVVAVVVVVAVAVVAVVVALLGMVILHTSQERALEMEVKFPCRKDLQAEMSRTNGCA